MVATRRVTRGAGDGAAASWGLRVMRLAAIALLFSAAAIAPGVAAAQESSARLFAAHALALRASGVAGGAEAAAVLAAAPGAGAFEAKESLSDLWSPFFANAVVKLARLRSPGPVALYYNPLLDIALLTFWERRDAGYFPMSARALPGERLADPDSVFALAPPWMRSRDGPLQALVRIAPARLDSFLRAHPAAASEAGRAPANFASAAADTRAVLPRLLWSAAEALRWIDGEIPWLEAALAEIERALAAPTPAALLEAAPDTDPETAAALADLPPAFADKLGLDMILEAGQDGRLLFASLPEDGHIYVVAECRVAGPDCALIRIALLPVLG